MRIYKTKKITLRLSGNADKFLKGISSNVSEAYHNAFLDTNGKIVAVFDQVRFSKDAYLVIIDEPFEERLVNHLKMYLKLNKTHLEKIPLSVYLDLDNHYKLGTDEYRIPQNSGQLLVSSKSLTVNVSDDEATLFRIRHQIPLQGQDYDREMLLNVFGESHLSFDKGCYLGQEIIARVYHKSKPPKKLCVFRESELDPALRASMTSRVSDPETGEILGFAFVANH